MDGVNSFMVEDLKEPRSAEQQPTLVGEDSSTGSTYKSSAEMSLITPNVNECKQEQPHNIHKVPIPSSELES